MNTTKEQTYTATEPVDLLVLTQELHDELDTESVTVFTREGLPQTASKDEPWVFSVVSDKSQPAVVKKVLKNHDPNKVEEDPEWDSIASKLNDPKAKLTAEELKLAVSKLSEKLG